MPRGVYNRKVEATRKKVLKKNRPIVLGYVILHNEDLLDDVLYSTLERATESAEAHADSGSEGDEYKICPVGQAAKQGGTISRTITIDWEAS